MASIYYETDTNTIWIETEEKETIIISTIGSIHDLRIRIKDDDLFIHTSYNDEEKEQRLSSLAQILEGVTPGSICQNCNKPLEGLIHHHRCIDGLGDR